MFCIYSNTEVRATKNKQTKQQQQQQKKAVKAWKYLPHDMDARWIKWGNARLVLNLRANFPLVQLSHTYLTVEHLMMKFSGLFGCRAHHHVHLSCPPDVVHVKRNFTFFFKWQRPRNEACVFFFTLAPIIVKNGRGLGMRLVCFTLDGVENIQGDVCGWVTRLCRRVSQPNTTNLAFRCIPAAVGH